MAEAKEYDTPARYKVLERSFMHDSVREGMGNRTEPFGGHIYEPGEEVWYSGHPGSNLEPLDDEGRKRRDYYLASKGITIEDLKEQKGVLTSGAPDKAGNLETLARGGEVLTGEALKRSQQKPPVPIPQGEQKPLTLPGQSPGNKTGHRSS